MHKEQSSSWQELIHLATSVATNPDLTSYRDMNFYFIFFFYLKYTAIWLPGEILYLKGGKEGY